MNCLPAYIDSELWDAFWDMRKKMGTRAPITDFGKKLILKELMKFHAEGYDANNSLEQSIMKGWRGVFQGELRSTKQADLNPELTKIVENSKTFKGMPDNIRAEIAKITKRVAA